MTVAKTKKTSNLCSNPLWRAEDLGKPIPESPHAVSVAMPLWEHVVGYEEKDPEVIDALTTGYPRFMFHSVVEQLFRVCADRFARAGQSSLAFPSGTVAERCAKYVRDRLDCQAQIDAFGTHGIFVTTLSHEGCEIAKEFWRHTGEIVSSRLAKAALEETECPSAGEEAKHTLQARLARLTGESLDNVFLYPTGMAAISDAHNMLQVCLPDAKTAQVGFPYVDVLKIQMKRSPGVHFFPHPGEDMIRSLETLLDNEKIAGVFCEFPSNPLLQSVDIPRLSAMLRAHDTPLIVDETLSTFVNVDLLPYADAVVTSLTKYFSGEGDVMGGSLVLNGESPFYQAFAEVQDTQYEDLLWGEDAVVLEKNSRDFPERVKQINETAEMVCEHLREHPAVDRVYYPKFETTEHFDQLRKAGGGYSGLFSILMKDPRATATPLYDRLRVSKGPSLGTNYTLSCPYTILAHYEELDWAEGLGISRYLVRVSVGLESPEDLIARFEEALDFS